jgi:hypothetical protein
MTWHPITVRFLLSAALVLAPVSWCACAVAAETSAAAPAAQNCHSAPSAAKPVKTDCHRDCDQSEQSDSCKVTVKAPSPSAGPTVVGDGSSWPTASALVAAADHWQHAIDADVPHRIDRSPPDAFARRSLRALHCLMTV